MNFSVDPWDPSYGVAFAEDMTGDPLRESTAELNLDFEVPADRWQPVAADGGEPVPSTILFLDGVRRIDARVWLHAGDAQPAPGIAASYAAGLVCLNGTARISDVAVERGLFTAAAEAVDIDSRHGRYIARKAAGPGMDQLSLALQQHLSETEVQLALLFRAAHPERELEVAVDPQLPALDADPALLRRVLDNLLDNARKYSDDGARITLAARWEDRALSVEVVDGGIGLDEADLARLFTPFFRSDRSRARGTGGVGLGLALAKRVVEAHGGRITAESAPAKGMRVRFSVPAAAAS